MPNDEGGGNVDFLEKSMLILIPVSADFGRLSGLVAFFVDGPSDQYDDDKGNAARISATTTW